MSLQGQIRTDMVAAMKAKESVRLSVLRGLITNCTNELTATKRTPQDVLLDDEVLAVIRRALKQRRDAAEQYRAGGREELAVREDDEAAILEVYLPTQMSEGEIAAVVTAKTQELGVTDRSGMGKLMGAVMGELKGKADGTLVKAVVERQFT